MLQMVASVWGGMMSTAGLELLAYPPVSQAKFPDETSRGVGGGWGGGGGEVM